MNPITSEQVEAMVDEAVILPGAITVAGVVYEDVVGDDLDPVVVLTLVFQLAGGDTFARQSFVIDPELATMLAEALTNPTPIPTEGTPT